ncbi:MAG TPA: DUF4430 domain-containing protein [Gaiellaceae bacterium]|nr:DUF4430 domain-containing protein [Gaiellaceae bacterium]
MRRLALLLLAIAVAGCGGAAGAHGTATLWVTRDRGTRVLYAGAVPAGLSAMQALERREKVSTRYGGRFVQSIDGIQGDASGQRDWFFFVNGVESNVGAADVRLRPGDLEWWDYRSWQGGAISVPLVVGAYPKPFTRGFEWAQPAPTSVVAAGVPRVVAVRIAAQVHGSVAARVHGRNAVVISDAFPPRRALLRRRGAGFVLELGALAARRLARDPHALAHEYGSAG